jgi:glycosyltransferase involved in cell wall biosynthesis
MYSRVFFRANKAITAARGKWIGYIDSDDAIAPDRESELRKIVGADREFYFSPYDIVEHGAWANYDLRAILAFQGETVQEFAERQNPSIPLGVCHTKELWERAGGFPPHVVCGSDGILWRRMINRCQARIGWLGKIAGTYIVRKDGQSRTRRKLDSGEGIDFDPTDPQGRHGQYLDTGG